MNKSPQKAGTNASKVSQDSQVETNTAAQDERSQAYSQRPGGARPPRPPVNQQSEASDTLSSSDRHPQNDGAVPYTEDENNGKGSQKRHHPLYHRPTRAAWIDDAELEYATKGLSPRLDFRAQYLLTWEYSTPERSWESFRNKVAHGNNQTFNETLSTLEAEYSQQHSLMMTDKLLDMYQAATAGGSFDDSLNDLMDDIYSDPTENSMEALTNEEKYLEREIEELKHRKQELLEEKEKEKQREYELRRKYNQVWELGRSLSCCRSKLADQHSSYRIRTRVLSRWLLKLQRLDATNDAFFIWHYGSMATINNLRIGLLPSHELDWREVNAALGHAALMLLVVANRLEYRLEPYIVIPMGSFSSVARHGDEQNADPLYCESNSKRKRLDKALVKLLHCVQSLVENRLQKYSNINIPYPIEDDKIGGVSIRSTDKVSWTQAMNFLLSDLKFLLVVSMNANDERLFQ